MGGLLEGVRVLDLTRVLAGPYATMILADLGAEVLKIELPGQGDEARGFGPFQNGQSAYFGSVNRGKKSVTIDLRHPEGSKLVQRLAGRCDVLIENFLPGRMQRFGIDYERLHARYPHLVYVSVSGFGQTGPYTQRPAYDIIIQAMAGIASITGIEGGPPVRVGASISDLNAALFTVIGILASLNNARQTGQGQLVDISMLDCQVALLENAIARYQCTGEVPGPLGSRHPSITPFQFFKASDGHIVIAAGNNNLWQRLCQALHLPELADDPRFIDNDRRTRNQHQLEPLLNKVLRDKTVDEWCSTLEKAGIPCSPIFDIAQLCRDPQVADRGMIKEMVHPRAGILGVVSSPLKFSNKPVELTVAAPSLGEHTKEVLGDLLGISAQALDKLQRDKVI